MQVWEVGWLGPHRGEWRGPRGPWPPSRWSCGAAWRGGPGLLGGACAGWSAHLGLLGAAGSRVLWGVSLGSPQPDSAQALGMPQLLTLVWFSTTLLDGGV